MGQTFETVDATETDLQIRVAELPNRTDIAVSDLPLLSLDAPPRSGREGES